MHFHNNNNNSNGHLNEILNDVQPFTLENPVPHILSYIFCSLSLWTKQVNDTYYSRKDARNRIRVIGQLTPFKMAIEQITISCLGFNFLRTFFPFLSIFPLFLNFSRFFSLFLFIFSLPLSFSLICSHVLAFAKYFKWNLLQLQWRACSEITKRPRNAHIPFRGIVDFSFHFI